MYKEAPNLFWRCFSFLFTQSKLAGKKGGEFKLKYEWQLKMIIIMTRKNDAVMKISMIISNKILP